jgi:phosphoacetylglucosamine mutase
MGEMLEASWEDYATELANTQSGEGLTAVLQKIIAFYKVDVSAPANVVFARDTRYVRPE